jgi:uncharacterized membrane protein
MRFKRLLRHVAATHWRTRLKFPKSTLDAIEAAVTRAERTHDGEICFAIETALAPVHVLNDLTPRARALEVFGRLHVWDTEQNNGVLIYVQLADRDVEIVADRGLQGRVSAAEWEGVCRLMEAHFKAGRFEAGSVAGVDAVGTLLARHYPSSAAASAAISETGKNTSNQLPDRPTLL